MKQSHNKGHANMAPIGLEKFILKLNNPFIFNNKKTWLSVDFGICPLMSLNENGNYHSKTCAGCYSATILGVYNDLRKKLEQNVIPNENSLIKFIADLESIKNKFPQIKRIRFYALSDFTGISNIPFIIAASRIFTVDIISKALSFPKNESSLLSLLNQPNIWISLSFNEKFLSPLERIKNLIKNADNCQINYCVSDREQEITAEIQNFLSQFQVIHMKHDDKLSAAQRMGIPFSKACGVYSEFGTLKNGQGSCVGCSNCHKSYRDSIAA